MPTVKFRLPTSADELSTLEDQFPLFADLYFTCEDGELIVSTEPLGDEPSVAPLTEGAYTP